MEQALYVDDSKYSAKILRSKVFNVVKNRIRVITAEEYHNSNAPSPEIHAFPTLVDGGSRYVGVRAILTRLEKLAEQERKKPLF